MLCYFLVKYIRNIVYTLESKERSYEKLFLIQVALR